KETVMSYWLKIAGLALISPIGAYLWLLVILFGKINDLESYLTKALFFRVISRSLAFCFVAIFMQYLVVLAFSGQLLTFSSYLTMVDNYGNTKVDFYSYTIISLILMYNAISWTFVLYEILLIGEKMGKKQHKN
ncbi:MAG: hypothetical protein MPJ24_09900, partial [Pirellulaceae bacterium]|nr:hypothetical protein [Pirellulaceae bacterium]